MASPVTVLGEQPSLAEVRRTVRGTRHNGFPIVRATPAGQVPPLCSCKRVLFVYWGTARWELLKANGIPTCMPPCLVYSCFL